MTAFAGLNPVDAIAMFGTPFTRRTFVAGTTDDDTGEFTKGAPTDITLTGVVWPSEPAEVKRLPEGMRDKEAITVLMSAALATAGEYGDIPPDRVVRNGIVYEVGAREPWVDTGVGPSANSFHVHVCARVEQ